MNGQGKFFVEGKLQYEGEWIDGKRHGQGKLLISNNWDAPTRRIIAHYEGDFKNDKYDGQGKMFYADGNRYEGEWKRARKHGQGKLFYTHGGHYEGGWKRGLCHGKGKEFDADGGSEEAYWFDGNKVDTTLVKDRRRDVDERVKKRFYKN